MTMLSFLDQPPVSWARKGRYGEGGSFGLQIDASGLSLRNRVMHRELIPATAEVSLHTRVRMKSSLVCSDNGFEGFAVRHRGFQLEGAIPAKSDRQVWDSNPQGKDSWIAGQHANWVTRSFLVAPPSDLGIDYVTWEAIVRAESGQISLSAIECRHAFTRPIIIPQEFGDKQWSGSSLQKETIDNSGPDYSGRRRYSVRYLGNPIPLSVTRGQEIEFNIIGCVMGGDLRPWITNTNIIGELEGAISAVIVKFRESATGAGQLYVIDSKFWPYVGQEVPLEGERKILAPTDFDQVEILLGIAAEPANDHQEPVMRLSGLLMNGKVSDFVVPSR